MLPVDWLISTSRHFCPPVSMVKDAMESVYTFCKETVVCWVLTGQASTAV